MNTSFIGVVVVVVVVVVVSRIVMTADVTILISTSPPPPNHYHQVPSPRSGCQMSVSVAGDCVFVMGGYSKVKQPDKKSEGKVHEDMWMLSLKNLPNGGSPVWERVSGV